MFVKSEIVARKFMFITTTVNHLFYCKEKCKLSHVNVLLR